jgi:ActR/RegA family two-component response regulator
MRVLFVDDDETFVAAVAPKLETIVGAGRLTVAKSLDSAIGALQTGEFDFFILDLKIPTVDGGLDEDVAHGQVVFREAQQRAPGTPVYFLPLLTSSWVHERLSGTCM